MVSSPFSPKENLSILVYIFFFIAIVAVVVIAFGITGTASSASEPSDILISQSAGGEEENAGINIVSSDENGLLFEVSPPGIVKSRIETDTGMFDRVRIPGYGNLGLEGHPDVPRTSYLVAIPPGAVPEITVLDAQSYLDQEIRVLPTARQHLANEYPDLVRDINEFVPEYETTYPVDQAVYTSDRFYPSSPVELGEVFWLRDRQVVRVLVQPVLANSGNQTIRIYSHLTVKLSFDYAHEAKSLTLETRPEGPGYESTLDESIINYEESRGWRMRRTFDAAPQPSPCMEENAFRLAIDETGMYEVGFDDLTASGWPVGIPVDDVRMCYQNAEIAIRVLDENDNDILDGLDSLIFYGQGVKTQETTTNIYWLSYYLDGSSGKRMVAAVDSAGGIAPDSYQASYHLEVDAEYYSSMPMTDANDHWYWRKTLVGVTDDPNQSMSTPFYFPNPVTGDGSNFQLRVMIWAYFRPEWHRVDVELNGQSLGSVDFFGSAIANNSLLYEANVPSSLLASGGDNVITVAALPHPDNPAAFPHRILLDWIEVKPYRYLVAQNNHLAFDLTSAGSEDTTIEVDGFSPGNADVDIFEVTNPQDVTWQRTTASNGSLSFRRLIDNARSFELAAAGTFLIPSSIDADSIRSPLLSNPDNEADMIIITDPSLDGALTPLRTLRSNQGLVVETVYVQDIFDEFSFGLYSTEAIKDFLAYVYENWSGNREYVLLAGEGSYDHRDILGLNGPGGNLVPVYLRSGIDRNLGEAAADNQYVDLDGDDLADMMLGRLPAKNSEELAIMVNKILAYEEEPVTAPWRARHLFVTDNGLVPFEDDCYQDPAADFFAVVDTFINEFFPPNHLLRRINYAPPQCYEQPEPYYASSVFEMQTGIVQKYNAGNQFVVYTGHSGTREWGHESFFNLQLANGVSNGDNTPIMLPMTCLVGIYHFPQGDNLSETLLKLNGGGSVASYAPTGLQVQNGHDYLLKGFYTSVFTDGVRIIGQAVFAAKLNLVSGPSSYQDLHDTFMLLGDPAMRMDMPDTLEQNFLPVTTK